VLAATKAEVEDHFNTHGTGEITEIKLMNGFGFIEYKDEMDARDVVPGKLSQRLIFRQVTPCMHTAHSLPHPDPHSPPFVMPRNGGSPANIAGSFPYVGT